MTFSEWDFPTPEGAGGRSILMSFFIISSKIADSSLMQALLRHDEVESLSLEMLSSMPLNTNWKSFSFYLTSLHASR